MTDFALTPDEDTVPASRQLRLVATGLADTADVPKAHANRPEPPSRYAPCEACGGMVLTGETSDGSRLALDTHLKAYVVQWLSGESIPRLSESRGYPAHRCAHAERSVYEPHP